MNAIRKVVSVGSLKGFGKVAPILFIEIHYDGKRLAFNGVEGPKKNGDAIGSYGQTIDSLSRILTYEPGFDAPKVERLQEIWRAWHLNDMRAGCEHQRAELWDHKPIDPSKPTNTYGLHFQGQISASWNMLTWVTREEHPEGLLSFPCPKCSYKYGSAWLLEGVPDDVIAWLAELPATSLAYPWKMIK